MYSGNLLFKSSLQVIVVDFQCSATFARLDHETFCRIYLFLQHGSAILHVFPLFLIPDTTPSLRLSWCYRVLSSGLALIWSLPPHPPITVSNWSLLCVPDSSLTSLTPLTCVTPALVCAPEPCLLPLSGSLQRFQCPCDERYRFLTSLNPFLDDQPSDPQHQPLNGTTRSLSGAALVSRQSQQDSNTDDLDTVAS